MLTSGSLAYPVGPYSPGLTLGSGMCGVSLARYAQILGIPDQEWWGVKRGASVQPRQLYWTGTERWRVAMRLCESMNLVASRMTVPLIPTWIADERRRYGNGNPIPLKWKHFIEAGVRARSTYAKSATVTYVGENGTVSVPHGGVGSRDEVRVFYVGYRWLAGPEPFSIRFGSNNIVVTFPKYRLVKPELMEDVPVAWETASNFVENLMVCREYNSPATQAEVRILDECSLTCTNVCQTGCLVLEDRDLSYVNVYPAVYSNGAWRRSRCWSGTPVELRANYRAGLEEMPLGLEDAIVRLAHSLMPNIECPSGKDTHMRFWKRDREKPEVYSRERINCPWGVYDGAWYAWQFVEEHPYNYGKGGGLM